MTLLTIGYSDSEDRLWLLFASDGAQLWLTRRLTSILIKRLAERMMISCPSAGNNYSLKPEIRIALEHEAAHEQTAQGNDSDAADQPQAQSQSPPPILTQGSIHQLTSVTINVSEDQIRLDAMGPGFSRKLQLSRAEAHRLLRALVRRSVAADWNLLALPKWLEDSTSTIEE